MSSSQVSTPKPLDARDDFAFIEDLSQRTEQNEISDNYDADASNIDKDKLYQSCRECLLCEAKQLANIHRINKWELEQAPLHRNIMWENLGEDSIIDSLKYFLINFLLFVVIIVFVNPLTLI